MKKELFELRGWKYVYEFNGEMNFEKGNFWKDNNGEGALLAVKGKSVKLTTSDEGYNQYGPNSSVKFNGECQNIEEFDMICKMIKLKI